MRAVAVGDARRDNDGPDRTMTSRLEIQRLEERSFNAWPARQTVFYDGWVFRLSDGLTKRANSASALAPTATFQTIRPAAEAFYARHSLPALFRLTPLADEAADRLLEGAGYSILDPCIVMTAPLQVTPDRIGDVTLGAAPDEQWLRGVAEANAIAPGARGVHDRMVLSVALPAAFATAYDNRLPVGFGMAVADRGMIGLFDITVLEAARARGVGKKLTAALLQWGQMQGASSCYLQTVQANTAATSLYAGLGFREAYRYHYRVRAE